MMFSKPKALMALTRVPTLGVIPVIVPRNPAGRWWNKILFWRRTGPVGVN